MLIGSILFWLFAYAFSGGCLYSIYARLEHDNLKHPMWVVFLGLFLGPAILLGLALIGTFAIGMGICQSLIDAIFPEKSVK